MNKQIDKFTKRADQFDKGQLVIGIAELKIILTNFTPNSQSISKEEVEELEDLLDTAWGIICNVKDWEKESDDWEKAVFNFREKYFKLLSKLKQDHIVDANEMVSKSKKKE